MVVAEGRPIILTTAQQRTSPHDGLPRLFDLPNDLFRLLRWVCRTRDRSPNHEMRRTCGDRFSWSYYARLISVSRSRWTHTRCDHEERIAQPSSQRSQFPSRTYDAVTTSFQRQACHVDHLFL